MPVAPAGQDLVRIGLVADVPDEAVVRRVEDVVQRDRQLDRAEARRRNGRRVVADASGSGTRAARRPRRQLADVQAAQVRGGGDPGQQRVIVQIDAHRCAKCTRCRRAAAWTRRRQVMHRCDGQ